MQRIARVMVSSVIPVPSFDLVIFGATGDLAKRKILPSLYRRLFVHQMPGSARVIGAARSKMSKVEFRKSVRETLTEFLEARDLVAVCGAIAKRVQVAWIDDRQVTAPRG